MKSHCIFKRNVNKITVSCTKNNKLITSITIAVITTVLSLKVNGANLPLSSLQQNTSADLIHVDQTRFKVTIVNRNVTPALKTIEENSKHGENITSDNGIESARHRAACVYPIQDFDDYRLTAVELLERAGYKTETHYVTTKDGYIFQIHRIPAIGKPVVYALHGFLQSSRDFLLNCDGRALAHKLINDGYDVWLGNFRGNVYGRNHTTISPRSSEFWTFSLDELFAYDGPAAVDYILNVTRQEKLNWVGFSYGGAVLFGMLSLHPEYNEKINLGVSVAPAVFLGDPTSKALRFFSKYRRFIEWFFFTLFKGEAFSQEMSLLYNLFAPNMCLKATARNRPAFCPAILWHVDGRDPGQLNHAYLPVLAAGSPSSTSARIIGQGLQWIARGKFEMYQYRSDKENIAKYGSLYPPEYTFSNTKIPIVNFWSENDGFIPKATILKGVSQIPNVIDNIRVNWPTWNHIDYFYGKDADILVYNHILKYLRKWNPLH